MRAGVEVSLFASYKLFQSRLGSLSYLLKEFAGEIPQIYWPFPGVSRTWSVQFVCVFPNTGHSKNRAHTILCEKLDFGTK